MNNQEQPFVPEGSGLATSAILSMKHHTPKADLLTPADTHYIGSDGKKHKLGDIDHEKLIQMLTKNGPETHKAAMEAALGKIIKADPMAGLFNPDLVREGKEAYGFGLTPTRKPILVSICTAYPYMSAQTRLKHELVGRVYGNFHRREQERRRLISNIRQGVKA